MQIPCRQAINMLGKAVVTWVVLQIRVSFYVPKIVRHLFLENYPHIPKVHFSSGARKKISAAMPTRLKTAEQGSPSTSESPGNNPNPTAPPFHKNSNFPNPQNPWPCTLNPKS